jgi:hypothetical protein
MSPDAEERIVIVPQSTPEEREAILAALAGAARAAPGTGAWAREDPEDEESGWF